VAIAIILIPIVSGIAKRIYLSLNPPPPEPPTVIYGKLPPLVFPPTDNTATVSYKLETISLSLPALPDQGKVYVVGINKSRLLELDRIKQKIAPLGFVNDPQQLDETNFLFVHPKIPAKLVVNVISRGFAFRYDWTIDTEPLPVKTVPQGNAAVAEAKEYFQRLGLLEADLASGNGRFQYLVATGSAMVPTDSFFEAQFVRVDLFRDNRDEMPIVTAGGDTAPVSLIISGHTNERKYIQANYQYSQLLENSFSTYPLKGVETAWQELLVGKGYIAKRTIPNVIIRKVYMGYYESNEPQQFMQPVYVFEGDGGFLAYVPAVTPDYWIPEEPTPTPGQ
jgi:hypothetical protein